MKRIIIVLIIVNICNTLYSQETINEKVLDSFFEYRSEITDYFTYYFREDYCNDMLYYQGRLMTIFGNIIDRKMISIEIIDFIIDLYKKTLGLKVPEEEIEMFIEAGLGKNGHILYTKILSIMYFMDLQVYENNFSENDQEIVKECIVKLKELFSPQEWDYTINYIEKKYN